MPVTSEGEGSLVADDVRAVMHRLLPGYEGLAGLFVIKDAYRAG